MTFAEKFNVFSVENISRNNIDIRNSDVSVLKNIDKRINYSDTIPLNYSGI